MRLVDADEFKKTILAEIERLYRVGHPYSATVVSDVIKKLDLEPSVDAEPVVHAHWILEKKYADGDADYKCSNCEFDDTFHSGFPEHFYKRCPHCGAKMDEEV